MTPIKNSAALTERVKAAKEQLQNYETALQFLVENHGYMVKKYWETLREELHIPENAYGLFYDTKTGLLEWYEKAASAVTVAEEDKGGA